MVKQLFSLTVIVFCIAFAIAADCPSYTKVLTCTPKCWQDSECSAIGGKCCPNICNDRSCVQPNMLPKSGSDYSPFNNKYNGGPGTYCGNVKCGPFERCITDRSTKRPKCVRY